MNLCISVVERLPNMPETPVQATALKVRAGKGEHGRRGEEDEKEEERTTRKQEANIHK